MPLPRLSLAYNPSFGGCSEAKGRTPVPGRLHRASAGEPVPRRRAEAVGCAMEEHSAMGARDRGGLGAGPSGSRRGRRGGGTAEGAPRALLPSHLPPPPAGRGSHASCRDANFAVPAQSAAIVSGAACDRSEGGGSG